MQVIDMGRYLYVGMEKSDTKRLTLALEWLKLQTAPGYVTETLIPFIEDVVTKS
jgi:hypothetical protein